MSTQASPSTDDYEPHGHILETTVPPATSTAGTPTQQLREKLFAFRFNDELTPSLRCSPRNYKRFLKFEEEDSALSSLPCGSSTSRQPTRRRHEPSLKREPPDEKLEPGARLPPKRARSSTGGANLQSPKKKAAYAPPETYAHLDNLSDHLGEGPDTLDVLFCGINPGQMSATVGHHFAHPTNHFWKCLHRSGLTDRQLSPSEDHTLPACYRLGLTNLVDRPSAQAAELASTEFASGVPALLHKIARTRPRVVCFVGKVIWDSFFRAAVLPLANTPASPPLASKTEHGADAPEVKTEPCTNTAFTFSAQVPTPPVKHEPEDASLALRSQQSPSLSQLQPPTPQLPSPTSRVSSPKKAGRAKKAQKRPKAARKPTQKAGPFRYDLQPYKVVHDATDAAVCETLFFVVVSTSGLVAGYQLPDKAKMFALLKQRVSELKSGMYDTSSMTAIPVPHIQPKC
ncbi:hypothetical protein C8Q80DRAFT_376677 [Daedaleopsis nitida]|nr:hypothetical protein C8Q80DRAFT_376677 [Daedaleopsis nitida]